MTMSNGYVDLDSVSESLALAIQELTENNGLAADAGALAVFSFTGSDYPHGEVTKEHMRTGMLFVEKGITCLARAMELIAASSQKNN